MNPELFLKSTFSDDPWTAMASSIGWVVAIWIIAWVAWCVAAYRFVLVKWFAPEAPDVAYYVGHLLAAVTTAVVCALLPQQHFGPLIYVMACAVVLLWGALKIGKINTARREAQASSDAAVARAAGS